MLTIPEDRAFWQAITTQDYQVPADYQADDLARHLLSYLGSTDPQLRDAFAYMILAHWMIRRTVSDDFLRQMIDVLSPNLQKGIGETGTNSVILRSFSALMLGYVINEDNKQSFLDADVVRTQFDQAMAYLQAEKDVRGWIPDTEWLHSTAHTADWLWMLAKSPHLDADSLRKMLAAIADKFMQHTGHAYIHGEDKRMARAVLGIFRRDLLPLAELEAWIDQLVGILDQADPASGFDPAFHSAYFNVKNLLQSIYFQLGIEEHQPPHAAELRRKIEAGLQKFTY